MHYITSLDQFGGVLQIASGQDAEQLAACVHPAAAATTDSAPPDDGRDYYRDGAEWIARPDSPSHAHQWDPASRAWVDPRTVNDLRAAAWERVKAGRDAVEFAPFAYSGNTWDGDATAQRRLGPVISISKSAIAAGLPFEHPWKTADNIVLILTARDFVAMEAAKVEQFGRAFMRAEDLLNKINAASDAAAIEAITWT